MNMLEKVFLILLILAFATCKSDPEKRNESANFEIEQLNYQSLKPILYKNDNKTYVVNFWATWCKPCVEELPFFEKINKIKNVKVILVSLDFPDQIESRLVPFIKEKNIQSKVVMMIDPDQNSWIPKINKEWTGAIPATLIYNSNKRKFYEQSFSYEQLQKEVTKFINYENN